MGLLFGKGHGRYRSDSRLRLGEGLSEESEELDVGRGRDERGDFDGAVDEREIYFVRKWSEGGRL